MKFIIIWLLCGFIAFGVINADLQGKYGWMGYENSRQNFAFSLGLGLLFGPIILMESPFVTGLYQHGWRIDFPIKSEKK